MTGLGDGAACGATWRFDGVGVRGSPDVLPCRVNLGSHAWPWRQAWWLRAGAGARAGGGSGDSGGVWCWFGKKEAGDGRFD
jgi:hypothetical protein